MYTAAVTIQPSRSIGTISPLLAGQFVEHLGRCVYGGIIDDGSALADENGYRQDVLAAVRELRPSYIRYPGGNFACDYHWEDGVGPRQARPRVYNLANCREEDNRFGTDEFLEYCRMLDTEPYLTVNLGNGTAKDAANWVEYVNGTTDSNYANRRRDNGRPEPYNVRFWGLGNEIYGDWVPGHKKAPEYVRAAEEYISCMKRVDPKIKTVACGCGAYDHDWDRLVFEALVDKVDYFSVHMYVGRWDYYDCLGGSAVIDRGLGFVEAAIRRAADLKKQTSYPPICFDEWNVWYKSGHDTFLEETFNLQDALLLASCFNVLKRHSAAVGMSNTSLMLNSVAPIMTHEGGLYKQTIFWPIRAFASLELGNTVLDTWTESPAFDCAHERTFAGIVPVEEAAANRFVDRVELHNVPFLDVAASQDVAGGKMILSVVNKHREQAADTRITILGAALNTTARLEVLTGDDPLAGNTMAQQTLITPVDDTIEVKRGVIHHEFPRMSHSIIEIPRT